MDAGKVSTQLITVVTVVAGFISLYPDAATWIFTQFGIAGNIVTGIIFIASAVWNYRNPRINEPTTA